MAQPSGSNQPLFPLPDGGTLVWQWVKTGGLLVDPGSKEQIPPWSRMSTMVTTWRRYEEVSKLTTVRLFLPPDDLSPVLPPLKNR